MIKILTFVCSFITGHMFIHIYIYMCVCVCVCLCVCVCEPGSSVGTVTDYGLDGPGSNHDGDVNFRPPDQPWGPTSLP